MEGEAEKAGRLTVYLLFRRSWDYDAHDDVVGVYATLARALEAAETVPATDGWGKAVKGVVRPSAPLGQAVAVADGHLDGWSIVAYDVVA